MASGKDLSWTMPATVESSRFRMPIPAARLIVILSGAATLSIGLITCLGWMLRLSRVVQMHPGWGGMVLMTAISFALAGAGVLASLLHETRLAGRIQFSAGALVCLIAATTFAEAWSNRSLGIDFPSLHAAMLPEYPAPGRMAPNTSLDFLLVGLALAVWGAWRKRQIVRGLALLVLLIGGGGFLGYCLGVEFLYAWYTSSGLVYMALPTSVGMLLLACGLWSLAQRDKTDVAPGYEDAHALRQFFFSSTAAVLLLTAGVTVAGSVGFMQRSILRLTSEHLSQLARSDRAIVELSIEQRSRSAAAAVADDAMLARQMRY